MPRKPIPVEPYIEKLEHAILLGATYQLAAAYAGISIKTFERWREQAATAKPDSALGRLRERLQHAEGRAAVTWLAQIERAAEEGDWHAAAWKLERRYPDRYGRRVQADLTLQIQQAAHDVANELGIEVEVLLAEAQAHLLEAPHGPPA
jgi:transposase